jgi:hypothetical protein
MIAFKGQAGYCRRIAREANAMRPIHVRWSGFVVATTAAVILFTNSALAQRKVPSAPSLKPTLQGDILCRAVDDFPGRSQDRFGIGEEVKFWVDRAEREGPEAVICWMATGATLYPVVGAGVIVDVGGEPGKFVVSAWREDGDSPKPPPPAPRADPRHWARDQVAALPKRERPGMAEEPPPAPAIPDALRKELHRMDSMRKGRETPFADVEALGRELLKKYTMPAERGQIYYQLVHVHAQSGLVHPERVIEYARKALEQPLEPLQAPRLYVYWGDAEQIARAKSKEPREARRKWATVIYLEGLLEVLQYRLPDKAPPLPAVSKRGDALLLAIRVQELKGGGKIMITDDMPARRRAEFQRAMIQHRDVLVGQILGLYGRGPAEPELRALAEGVLRDPMAVERLLAAMRGGKWEYR